MHFDKYYQGKIPVHKTVLDNDNWIREFWNNADLKYGDCVDLMVYKLYDLTWDEALIVDPELPGIISREDYEKAGMEELAEWENVWNGIEADDADYTDYLSNPKICFNHSSDN